MKKIKLLIVDDSVLFRSQIQQALQGVESIEIVGSASNGKIAIEKMLYQEIDVCTLDIEMPELDGIETLKEMKLKGIKTKAIMFSSQSTAGAEKTLEAMRLGALDFVAKPMPDQSKLSPSEKIKEVLYPKLEALFSTERVKPFTGFTKTHAQLIWETFKPEILVIGSSTGGPTALEEFFSVFNEPCPFPIVIAQHMPPVFTASLAQRLGEVARKSAQEGRHGDVLKPDHVYVAPGDFHLSLTGDRQNTIIQLDQREKRNFVRPCVDYLFESAARIYGKNVLSIVFTGMGRDGADGAAMIKSVQGTVMIQDEASCVVFGMPGAVFSAGDYDFSGTPKELAHKVLQVSKRLKGYYVA